MNFFERQDQARGKSRQLIFLFICAVLGTFLAVHALVVGVFMLSSNIQELDAGDYFWQFFSRPELLAIDFFAVSLLVLGGSLYKVWSLNSLGPDGVAEMFNGRRVSRSTTNMSEKRLLNVVEEMALASGVRVPNVYVLQRERRINACAIGGDPNSSVIAVTEGALDYLNRDELQGVVAHEFSHILNGDTKINMRLIGILFGLQMLTIVGFGIFRSTWFICIDNDVDGDRKGSLPILLAIWLFALGLIVIGLIGFFFSNVIRAAVSRQREFLADASAVQFTRNPNGIAGALKKIGCPRVGSLVYASHSTEMAHLFFGNIFPNGIASFLFRTHPDLVERIKRIEPTFDGNFPQSLDKNGANIERQTTFGANAVNSANSATRLGETISVATAVLGAGALEARQKSADANIADALMGAVGEQSFEKLEIASALIEAIPSELDAFLVDANAARAVVYAMLLDKNAEIQRKQVETLRKFEEAAFDVAVWDAFNSIEKTSLSTRISIVQLTFPLLKTMNVAQYRKFRQATLEFCAADGKIDLFEYTIQASIINDLDVYFKLSRGPQIQFSKFDAIFEPFRVALSYLAREGANDVAEVEKAFQKGFSYFYIESTLVPLEECSLGAFSRALNLLARSTPILKQKLLIAFYRCVAADGVVTEREGALIYAISAALGCPAPIWGKWAK